MQNNSSIRLTKDGLDMLYQIRDGKILRLLIQRGGKSVYFFGENEFRLSIEISGQTTLIRSRDCDAADIMKISSDALKISYEHELFSADVLYSIKNGVFYKTLTLTAKAPFLLKHIATETLQTPSKLTRGGEGQPVFAGGEMFIGAEFPSACNDFSDDQLDIRQNPYIQLETGGVFNSFDVVFGFRGGETLERTFESHIRSHAPKKDRPLKIYSDWGLHDELSDNICLGDKMVKDMICCINDLRHKDDVNFDYYLMDAFWWEDGCRYIDFKKSVWPDGISEIKEKLSAASLKFGLWFDTNMALVKLSENESSQSSGGRFCMADKRTTELLKTAILYHIKNTGIKMIKFDFAYFDCENPEHKFHACGGAESKEPAIRNFIEMIRKLREAEPELKILCYNGFTTDLSWIGSVIEGRSGYAVSPYWAFYVDYVYCGDPRASEIPSENLDKSIICYTDAMIKQMRDALLPFDYIDDSGTMCANTGTIYYLGKATLRDGWIMSLSRGSRKLHFYGDLGLLDHTDRVFLHEAEKMFDKISEKRYDTEFILADPASGKPYGYSTSDGVDGIITVVNPSSSDETVNISIDEWADGKNVKIRRWYSDNEIHTGTAYKNTVKVFQTEVKPQSVTSFFWTVDNGCYDGQLRIVLSPGERVSIPVSDKAQTVSVSFQNPDKTPIRTLAGIPDSLTLEYDTKALKQIPEKRPWSGSSWVVLKKTDKSGVAVCTLENKGSQKVVVLWKETD